MGTQTKKPVLLNALNVYCPDLYAVLKMFVEQQRDQQRIIQVVTKEPNSKSRVDHYCQAHGYEFEHKVENGIHLFQIDLQSELIN